MTTGRSRGYVRRFYHFHRLAVFLAPMCSVRARHAATTLLKRRLPNPFFARALADFCCTIGLQGSPLYPRRQSLAAVGPPRPTGPCRVHVHLRGCHQQPRISQVLPVESHARSRRSLLHRHHRDNHHLLHGQGHGPTHLPTLRRCPFR
jgi:hypothetical protein